MLVLGLLAMSPDKDKTLQRLRVGKCNAQALESEIELSGRGLFLHLPPANC